MTMAARPSTLPTELSQCYGETGLSLPRGLPIGTWGDLRMPLEAAGESYLWALGDWFLYGEEEFGEDASQYFPDEEYSDSRKKAVRWVASVFPTDRRRSFLATGMTWSHHRLVGAFEPDVQDQWLDLAEAEKLSTRQLNERIREADGKTVHRLDKDAALGLSSEAIGREWTDTDHAALAAYLGVSE